MSIRSYDQLKAALGCLIVGDDLTAKTVRGSAWLGTGSIVEQAARFARNMLLARLLAPAAFGTMAIVLSSGALIETITDVGVWLAIIQNPRGGRDAYVNASWWIGMGRATLSYLTIFTVAPWIATFYGHAELSGLLRVALLGTVFNAAISPRSILVQRNMKFPRWAGITNGGAICGVMLTVVLSFAIRDVWALAVGYCSENIFRFVLSYLLCPGLPSRKCDWSAVRDLLTFSRGLLGLALLNLIIARSDIFVLARLYSPTGLGLYTMAVALVTTPSVFFTNVLGKALMPALSSVQNDMERLNRILVKVTSLLILAGIPVVAFIALCAASLLRVIYGNRYVEAVGPLSVASAVVFLVIVNAAVTGVLLATGRPQLHRQAVAATAAIILITIYPACRVLGFIGGQLAALLAVAVGYLLQLVRVHAVTNLNMSRYGAAFVPAALGCAGMMGVVLGGRWLGLATRPAADICLCLGGCVAAYAICASDRVRALGRLDSLFSPGTGDVAALGQ